MKSISKHDLPGRPLPEIEPITLEAQMSSTTVADLLVELEDVRGLIAHIGSVVQIEDDKWYLQRMAYDFEVETVIELGKHLTGYCPHPVPTWRESSEGAFQEWIDFRIGILLDESVSSYYRFCQRPCLVQLLFSCFDSREDLGIWDGHERGHGGASGPKGYSAYLQALESGKAKPIIAAFANSKIPPELLPLKWPMRLIEGHGKYENALRRSRLLDAAFEFATYLETRTVPSLFTQLYVDLGTATRDMVEYPNRSPDEFDALSAQLTKHYRRLQQLPPHFLVEADESGGLRVVSSHSVEGETMPPPKPVRTKKPRKKSLGKKFIVQNHFGQHHQGEGDYNDLVFEPLRVNETAARIKVNPRDVSLVLKMYFDGFAVYERKCLARDAIWLNDRLRVLERDINKAINTDTENDAGNNLSS